MNDVPKPLGLLDPQQQILNLQNETLEKLGELMPLISLLDQPEGEEKIGELLKDTLLQVQRDLNQSYHARVAQQKVNAQLQEQLVAQGKLLATTARQIAQLHQMLMAPAD